MRDWTYLHKSTTLVAKEHCIHESNDVLILDISGPTLLLRRRACHDEIWESSYTTFQRSRHRPALFPFQHVPVLNRMSSFVVMPAPPSNAAV
jgi:hypothetical protein